MQLAGGEGGEGLNGELPVAELQPVAGRVSRGKPGLHAEDRRGALQAAGVAGDRQRPGQAVEGPVQQGLDDDFRADPGGVAHGDDQRLRHRHSPRHIMTS